MTAQEPARLEGRLVGPGGPLANRSLVAKVFSASSSGSTDRKVVTDASGRFSIRFEPRSSRGLFLDLRPLGYREAVQFIDPRAGDRVDLGDLGPPAQLRGRLVDAVGDVVPLDSKPPGGGLSGRANQQTYAFTLERAPLGERGQVKVYMPDGPMAPQEVQGEFLVDRLLPGRASIRQHREAPVEVELEGGHETFVEIPFRGLGVVVELEFGWGKIQLDPAAVLLTDPAGRRVPPSAVWGRRIEYDGLQGGPFVLSLEDPRFVEVPPQVVKLQQVATLQLVPLESLQLEVHAPDGRRLEEWSAWVYAEDGEFEARAGRLPLLASAPAELVVLAEGYPPWASPWSDEDAAGALRVDLVPGTPRAVEVAWADGLPVSGAFVYFMHSPGGLEYEVECGPTDELGRCAISGIAPYGGVLEVDLGGGCTIARPVADPLAEDPLRLELEGGWLDLEVELPEGMAPRGAVLVSAEGPQGAVPDRLVDRDRRGRYRFGPLEPGPWELAVTIQVRGGEWSGRVDGVVPQEEGQYLVVEPRR